MLALTTNAAAAISTLFGRPNLPATAGLRIARGDDRGFALSTVVAPGDGDQILDMEGARVFLEPEAAAALEHMVLDAHVDGEGRLRFVVSDKASLD